ncbi:MAG: SDR family oxidoreductase [Burkholderiaceae bacterium]
MVVFLTGASGFIGQHLAQALRAAGHRVIAGVHSRAPDEGESIEVDFTRDFEPAQWRPRLRGVDAVINAVGLIRETRGMTFDAVHVRAPRALFAAAAETGVRRVIQISALGADDRAASEYHASKRRADDFLSAMPLSSVIVQPSLVYGRGGASARLFDGLASLPLLPLPDGGRQRIQPIHIHDLVPAVVALLERDAWRVGRVALVGPEPITLYDYLVALRRAMGLPPARAFTVPRPLLVAAARVGDRLPGLLLDSATLGMLERGNTADARSTRQLLGHDPRPPGRFIGAGERQLVRNGARLQWLAPLLRVSIAVMWIVTGVVSLAVYPIAESYALLARTGITGRAAPLARGAAALLDIALGAATLALRRRWVWWAQIVLILGYTAIITWHLPEFWAHPYGPVLKNVPILAALLLLAHLEER